MNKTIVKLLFLVPAKLSAEQDEPGKLLMKEFYNNPSYEDSIIEIKNLESKSEHYTATNTDSKAIAIYETDSSFAVDSNSKTRNLHLSDELFFPEIHPLSKEENKNITQLLPFKQFKSTALNLFEGNFQKEHLHWKYNNNYIFKTHFEIKSEWFIFTADANYFNNAYFSNLGIKDLFASKKSPEYNSILELNNMANANFSISEKVFFATLSRNVFYKTNGLLESESLKLALRTTLTDAQKLTVYIENWKNDNILIKERTISCVNAGTEFNAKLNKKTTFSGNIKYDILGKQHKTESYNTISYTINSTNSCNIQINTAIATAKNNAKNNSYLIGFQYKRMLSPSVSLITSAVKDSNIEGIHANAKVEWKKSENIQLFIELDSNATLFNDTVNVAFKCKYSI